MYTKLNVVEWTNTKNYDNINILAVTFCSTRVDNLKKGSGTFLAERAMTALYLKIDLHESHKIGQWCCMGPQYFLMRH